MKIRIKENPMKTRITASENFQTVEVVVDVLSFQQITEILLELRQAIKDATKDVQSKSKKEEKIEVKMATQGQIKYLHNLGWSGDETQLTFDEASEIISQMGGSKLKAKQ